MHVTTSHIISKVDQQSYDIVHLYRYPLSSLSRSIPYFDTIAYWEEVRKANPQSGVVKSLLKGTFAG